MNTNTTKNFHSLIPVGDFKAIMGIDDREDELARFVLAASTDAIERYCRRSLVYRVHREYLDYYGDSLLTLREYPVRRVLGVWADAGRVWGAGTALDRGRYAVVPEPGGREDFEHSLYIDARMKAPKDALKNSKPFSASYVFSRFSTENCENTALKSTLKNARCIFQCVPEGEKVIKVKYAAGYRTGEIEADLGAACLELAAWNYGRYRGKRIGMTGTVRGRGADGEHFEERMPANVRGLLEVYARKGV